MRSARRLLLVVFLLVTLAAVAALALFVLPGRQDTATPQAQAERGAPVIVAQAEAARDDVMVDVVGTALASKAVTVFAAAAGEVERVNFVAGQRVEAGDLLVQLVDRSEKLAVEQARTRVAAAARLLKRYENTRGTGAVPDSVLDEARLALRSAELELGLAREALRDRTVIAPFSGVVGIAQVDPGNRITPTTALTTLDQRDPLIVVFQVPEPFVARLQRGRTIRLASVTYPGREFAGTLEHVDSRLDLATRSVTVRASVPNSEDLLRPGMSFSVRIELPGEEALRVPELAVQWGRDGSHVWVVRDSMAHQVPVRVVRRLDATVLVDGALQVGEAVVTEGFHRLRPQRKVEVVQQEPKQVKP